MKAIIGDHQALDISLDYNWGYPGLPIWDIELRNQIETLVNSDVEKVFFSCGYPLMGFQKKGEILRLNSNESIVFSQDERGFFYKQENWKKLSEEENAMLFEQFFKTLDNIIEGLKDKIIFLPITAYFHEKIRKTKVNTPSVYDYLLSNNYSTVKLENLLTNKLQFKNQYGRLTRKSVETIQGNLMQGI